jgi:hypothetical protein
VFLLDTVAIIHLIFDSYPEEKPPLPANSGCGGLFSGRSESKYLPTRYINQSICRGYDQFREELEWMGMLANSWPGGNDPIILGDQLLYLKIEVGESSQELLKIESSLSFIHRTRRAGRVGLNLRIEITDASIDVVLVQLIDQTADNLDIFLLRHGISPKLPL